MCGRRRRGPTGERHRRRGKHRQPGRLRDADGRAVDTKLVPAAAWIEVGQRTTVGGATTVRLRVDGMVPGHAYAVHVHQKPCGADPAAAGGHFQHKPSTDPADVTADNEVWLDFTADEHGAGEASARHDWNFREGEASSVVIHDMPGSRVRAACFTVPFGWAP
ncbi:superoxide dismutase family protein [Streptomyces sp. MBT62]|uniref:superoxide dismutase family protein n=1 Tax=Streptomyces sp. MBT62 TaxID=2800410 RepID=UPI0027DB10A3|nr:superoxide dismutase family protein [Streptomyces sp. MBT62]